MADRTIKPDDTNDLVLQNNDGSAKLELNEDQTVKVTTGSDAGEDFTVNSSQLVVEGDTGNVGIGGSPTEKFNVTENKAGAFASVIKNTNATGSGLKVIGADTTQYSLIVRDKDDVTDSLVVLGNGKVGIGTTSAAAPISVLGPTSNTLQATISGGSGGTARGLHISTATTGTSSNDIVIFDCPIATGTLAFQTNSVERMRIDSSGDVYSAAFTDISSSTAVPGGIATSGSFKYVFSKRLGKQIIIYFYVGGTSNGTNFTLSLPFAVRNTTGLNPHIIVGAAVDNGANQGVGNSTNQCSGIASFGTSVINFKRGGSTTGWTSSGTKEIIGQLTYEVNSL